MEVLPSSGSHYIGESDCTQQGSGTAFMHEKESNGLKHEPQVPVADMQLDQLVLNVEETQTQRQGEDQWTDEYELDMERRNLSCDSHDSEDDILNSEDQGSEPCFASEGSHLIVDANESSLPSNGQEGESSLLESKWLEQDEPMAVWVKWRGKWQAGIRCARADWPLPTLKAKPTHDRKNYIVIYFPRTRNYSWADVLLVRPINEFPQPIAYKTHKVGVKMVGDLTLARRFIMQKLAVSMLNIIDQLHIKALVETARNMTVWNEFAMEASRCKVYFDLGRMLLKLQNMILQSCLSPDWVQHYFHSWAQRCQNACSAELVEMLKEELFDSILWQEVNSLSDVAVQPELGSELKTWKQGAMKWFSTSHPLSSERNLEQHGNDTPLSPGLQISRKRPKLEIRRAETHGSHLETHDLNPPMDVEIDSRFFNGQDLISMEDGAVAEHPASAAARWGEIAVEMGNSGVIQIKDLQLTPVNVAVSGKSLDSANKSLQCSAFIEAKGRQCVRWANDGDIYCCVHLASRNVANIAKSAAIPSPPVDTHMCGGTTVLGTKCKHRSLFGSPFCKKHTPKNDTKVSTSSLDNTFKIKHEETISGSEVTNCREIVLVAENFETPLQVTPISVMAGEMNCIGSCPQDGNEPCTGTPKRHSLYCEKHIPSWLKRARNGKSRIVSKEVFLELLKDCHSRDQKVHLHHACDLFYRLFKSVLSQRNPVPKDVQLQWAVSEASKDIRVGELLMKLVFSEIDRLRNIWGFNADKDTQASLVENPVSIPVATDSDHGAEDTITCKICSEKFLDHQSLGAHWMDRHKKEAQWLFRGYVCAICFDSFTNKKVLETHVQERHRVEFVEQCVLFQCVSCGSHFGNPEQLWLHVLSVHSANLMPPKATQQHDLPVGEDSSQKLETGSANSAAYIENYNSENQGGLRKFFCRFCGLKFDLLPDLGRHHQSAHMGLNSVVGPRPLKRGIRYYAYKLKSGRLSRPRFRKGLGGASYRMRNRNNASANLKKLIQSSNSVSNGEIKMQSHVTEVTSLNKLEESQCLTVAKSLFSEIRRTKPRPNNLDILSVARSACCKFSLHASLEEKYGLLPERLYLRAAKLCSEHNIIVEWHKEGFLCPRGCKPITDSHLAAPSLMPLSDGVVEPRSALALDPVNKEWEMDECHYIIDSRHLRPDNIQKIIILCDDISFGQESIPIACVVDENLLGSVKTLAQSSDGQTTANSMPWKSFTYVMKPLVNQSFSLEAQSLQLGCACTYSTCSPKSCDHVYLFDNDYEDARDIYGKPMNGRFPYDESGRIILEEGYLVYECNHMCRCNRSCQNRVLQNGVRVKLEIFKSERKGWAVRAGEMILRGTFICEFIGEVIDEQEANKRRNRDGGEGCRYFYDIDAHINDMSRLIEGQGTYVIDSTNYGNVSRYINHSCSPNLVSHQVLVESMDFQLAHIGLYASRDIAAGEELTYDYRYKLLPGEGCPCQCRASNCKGRLY